MQITVGMCKLSHLFWHLTSFIRVQCSTCEIVELFSVKVGRDGPAHPLDANRGVEQLQQVIVPQHFQHGEHSEKAALLID